MKKVLVMLTLVAAVSAYSQGTVNFNNFVSGSINAPISYDTTGPLAFAAATKVNGATATSVGGFTWGGVNAQAGLYGGAPGTAPDAMVLLVPAVGFRTGGAAGFVNVGSSGSRTIDGILGKSPADFVIKAWDTGVAGTASYEDAKALAAQRGAYLGQSAVVHVLSLGGAGAPVDPPANLVGLTSFNMTFVPEPSIIGLGLLGAVAGMVVFRRRS